MDACMHACLYLGGVGEGRLPERRAHAHVHAHRRRAVCQSGERACGWYDMRAASAGGESARLCRQLRPTCRVSARVGSSHAHSHLRSLAATPLKPAGRVRCRNAAASTAVHPLFALVDRKRSGSSSLPRAGPPSRARCRRRAASSAGRWKRPFVRIDASLCSARTGASRCSVSEASLPSSSHVALRMAAALEQSAVPRNSRDLQSASLTGRAPRCVAVGQVRLLSSLHWSREVSVAARATGKARIEASKIKPPRGARRRPARRDMWSRVLEYDMWSLVQTHRRRRITKTKSKTP